MKDHPGKSHDLEIVEDDRIRIVRFNGELDALEILNFGHEFMVEAINDGYKVIFDFRDAILNLKISQVTGLINKQSSEWSKEVKRQPIAVIRSKKYATIFELAKLTWSYSDLLVHVAVDDLEAIEWLKTISRTANN